jgi:hypothetical protein
MRSRISTKIKLNRCLQEAIVTIQKSTHSTIRAMYQKGQLKDVLYKDDVQNKQNAATIRKYFDNCSNEICITTSSI